MARYRLRDLLVVTFLIAVLLATLLPMIQRAREDARRMSCAGHMKQIALALHNYHSAFGCLPSAMYGANVNGYRLSGFIGVTPFFEQQRLWEEIHSVAVQGFAGPSNVPSPEDQSFGPWKEDVEYWTCPSKPQRWSGNAASFGAINYTFSIGDTATNIHSAKSMNQVRGMFSPRVWVKFNDVVDGLSNTVMATEIPNAVSRSTFGDFTVNSPASVLNRPVDCINSLDPKSTTFILADNKFSKLGRGGNWADGAAGHSLVNTILPPNSPSCGITVTPTDGLFSAGSYHPGGCHVLMGDGAVQFVSDAIDTGDLSAAPPTTVADDQGIPIKSPYGVWGAIGTRAGTERFDGF